MRLTRLLVAVIVAAGAATPLFAANPQPPSSREWIDSPQAYFVTAEERNQWDLVAHSDEGAARYIDEYWRRHGAAFKREVMGRMEFADANFGFSGIPGSRTPRGRVWMILGSPSTQKGIRPAVNRNIGGGAQLQNNSIEQKGRTTIVWTYRADRLPKELNLPSLTVNFIQDMSHSLENIDNVGQ